jgi:recombination protein RecA
VLEEAFEKADELISAGLIYALVVDSLDGLIPRKQDDNSYANTMGSVAGAIASHLPSLYGKLAENKITSIFIKQARVKMDTMSKGEVITFSGGKALRHFADTIFIFKRLSNRNLTYTPIQVKAEKTRSARMGLTLQMPLGEIGIDVNRDLVDLAVAHGYLEFGGGGWIEFNGKKLQGMDRFMEELKDNPEFLAKLWTDVYDDIINQSKVICASTGEMIVDDGIGQDDV